MRIHYAIYGLVYVVHIPEVDFDQSFTKTALVHLSQICDFNVAVNTSGLYLLKLKNPNRMFVFTSLSEAFDYASSQGFNNIDLHNEIHITSNVEAMNALLLSRLLVESVRNYFSLDEILVQDTLF